MSRVRPVRVLFVCSRNAVRSPMAAALTAHLYGARVAVESAGVSPETPDSIAAQVMAEMNVDIAGHEPRGVEGAGAPFFDVIIALSADARAATADLAPNISVEYWPMPDVTAFEGSREMRLAAYRELRDKLVTRISERFGGAH